MIERAVILSAGPELQVTLTEVKPTSDRPTSMSPVSMTGTSTLESVERDHIVRVLEETKWIVGGPNGAAVRLGIKRQTLQAKMLKLGISRR